MKNKKKKKTRLTETHRPHTPIEPTAWLCVPNISAQFTAQYFMTLTQFDISRVHTYREKKKRGKIK